MRLWRDGWQELLFCHREPADLLSVWGTTCRLLPSLFGVVALNVGDAMLTTRVARFMAALSCLCIFTKYHKFAQHFVNLVATLRNASSLVASLLALICIYALAARNMFTDKALDDLGEPFFGTYAQSLSTFFRLFVGEG